MKLILENWRKHLNEGGAKNYGHYEPGRAVADIDTGEEHMGPEDLEREEFEDLADKFNVKLEFEMKRGYRIAKVTMEDGEVMHYSDPEEMYQDLARYYEMGELDEGADLEPAVKTLAHAGIAEHPESVRKELMQLVAGLDPRNPEELQQLANMVAQLMGASQENIEGGYGLFTSNYSKSFFVDVKKED